MRETSDGGDRAARRAAADAVVVGGPGGRGGHCRWFGGGLIPQEAIPGLLAERDRIAAGMATRVGAVGREVVGRIGTYETVINDAVRLLADHGFVPPAERDAGPPPAPVVEYGGGADPSRVRRPADGRLRRGPGEHRAGELRRGRDRPAVRRPARRVDLRAHLQLPVGPGRGVRCRAGRRGRRPAWWRAPGPRSSRVRTGSGSPSRAPGRASGGPSGSTRWWSGRGPAWCWRGSTGGAGSSTPRAGWSAPGPARAPRSGSGTTTTAGWSSWSTSAGAGWAVEWDGDRDRGGVRLGRAARRLPLRPTGLLAEADGPAGRAPLRVGRRGPGRRR